MGKNKVKKDNKYIASNEHRDSKIAKISLVVSVLSLITSIIIARFSYNITTSINEEAKKNYNLSYKLKIVDNGVCGNKVMIDNFNDPDKRENAKFTSGAFYYKLIKGKYSGEYSEKYLAVVNNGDIEIKTITDKLTMFINFGNKNNSYSSQIGKMRNDKTNCQDPFTFGIFYGDASNLYEQLDPITIIHYVLKGYNGAYQYFTAIHYFDENDNNLMIPYKTKIIHDTDLYDNDIMREVVSSIKSDLYPDFKILRDKIEEERNLIKTKLER